ncbi:hypothetical protein C8J56DRAFT_967961 [Mycena floridula]|nr:hypothetical protein C8J56DRAFT_967961 [Mycena floridula]
MSQDFGEYASPTDTIAAILATYPFSVSCFRELLQNSDDAGASKQVLVLDSRQHLRRSLFSEKLSDTQGPALLAFNDSLFSPADWDALQSIHRSSKKADTSKIGKYGVGFRSLYHLTDNPQILSGTSLAILDPHHNFTDSGGTKLDFVELGKKYVDQLAGFQFFLPDVASHNIAFQGSIIRLPLRTSNARSTLSTKVVEAKEIRTLFDDFIREELDIALLFLRNLCAIEIHEIDRNGVKHCLAQVSITKDTATHWNSDSDQYSTFTATVNIETPNLKAVKKWRILQSSFAESSSASLISYRMGRDARPVLSKHKLIPELSMAVPLSQDHIISGRLFTYLPLPIWTGFKCHVHGLFALTQSRQNLTNKTEIGIVRGSDDSVLVEWNQTLFSTYLPKTWAALLRVLTRMGEVSDVFHAWPPHQNPVETGESVYWQNLPIAVLSAVVASKAPIWPLVSHNAATPVHVELTSEALVAPAGISEDLLAASIRAGLEIIRPPTYLLDLMGMADIGYKLMTPLVVATALQTTTSQLQKLATERSDDCLTILQYLVSSQDISHIIGLPIVPLISGQFIPLVSTETASGAIYTMFERPEFEIFVKFDGRAIALHKLPFQAATLLREQGHILNVALLSAERVVSYLNLNPNPLGLDFTKSSQVLSDSSVDWLTRFWGGWFRQASAGLRFALFPSIQDMFLLPTRAGSLESLSNGVFVAEGVPSSILTVLQSLGLSFLHNRFSEAASSAVKEASLQHVIKYPIQSFHDLVDQLQLPKEGLQMDKETSSALLSFITRAVIQACRELPLNDSQKDKLRSLPIYPTLSPSSSAVKSERSSRIFSALGKATRTTNIIRTIGAIPEKSTIHGIPGLNTLPLPMIRTTVYIDGSSADLGLLKYLSNEDSVPLTDIDILTLGLEHFASQSKYIQGAFMDFMVQNRDNLPPRVMKVLQKARFIPVIDGTLQAAEHIVDPKSPLPALFADSSDRIPKSVSSRSDDEVQVLLKQLRVLGLLRDKLTPQIVLERVQSISSSHSHNPKGSRTVAVRLLDLLFTSNFDCSTLEFPFEAKWLPTNHGMSSHEECLDRGSHRPEFFDEVLPLLDDIQVSPSLRASFGWDKPLPFSTLTRQLELVIAKGDEAYKKLRALIKELAQRYLSGEDIRAIMVITRDKKWIPISSGRLAKTSHAVFTLPVALSGFYEIPHTLTERHEVREFLSQMGCSDRPSIEILAAELRKLQVASVGTSTVEQGIQILRALPFDMDDRERDQIVVPDSESIFKPVSEVYFNDLGDRAYYEVGDTCLAHPALDEQIARKLRMRRLGLKSLHIDRPGVDMGEKLSTTIRNVLKQYTDQQTLNEFLANACDAGADEFKILFDDRASPTEKLLSRHMAPFQTCSSLIVYNNSVFSQKDFEGICAVGIGGKEGRTNTIGQFGLGSLSMFHFTELATILSGDKVLFLNPSKTHLPFEDWASLLVPLSQVQRLYPDHLAALDGLFEYQLSHTTYYSGTIFRLPLRTKEHISDKSILQNPCTAVYVREKVVRAYWKQASQSLLFTKMKSISTFYRDSSGQQFQGWSIFANRVQLPGDFNSHMLQITGRVSPDAGVVKDEYEIVTSSISLSDLPAEFKPLVDPHRLRSPIVLGLAARTNTQENSSLHSLFSTLPLPMMTTLPVHLTASFILTPDRRHIRFDEFANLESKYNRWLLAHIAPPMYLFLLEDLLRTHGSNEIWWPGNTAQQDSITGVLVDSFYNLYLANSRRLVCSSLFDSTLHLAPGNAVLLGSEPPPITKLLSLLANPRYINLPPIVRERSIRAFKSVDPVFLKDEIGRQRDHVKALFRDGRIMYQDIQCLLDFLSADEALDLSMLPLVPLANGSLALLKQAASTSDALYVWKPSMDDQPLFHPHRLVHPDFYADSLLSNNYNVSNLDCDAIETLVKEHIDPGDVLTKATAEQSQWIATFWKEFSTFPWPSPNVDQFPLVATMRKGHFVSIKACRTNPSVTVKSEMESWLSSCLLTLKMTVVDLTTLSQMLQTSLRTSEYEFSFDKLLMFVKSVNNFEANFLALDLSSRIMFAEWARKHVNYVKPENFAAAKALPIWSQIATPDVQVRFRCATDVQMLPYSSPREAIARFSTAPLTDFSTELRYLGVEPITFSQLWPLLTIPSTLAVADRAPYRQILTRCLGDSSFEHRNKLLIPNGQGLLVKGKTLFARHALFNAAFGVSPENFLLEEYRDLEDLLTAVGLKTPRNLDFQTFKQCAISMSTDTAVDRSERAIIVFRAYCEDLPLFINDSDSDWKDVDNLRFIPRDPVRQKSMRMLEGSPYVRSLPELVSPTEVLRLDLEAIGWTQRALFLVEPHSRILLSNHTLGIPTIEEVVRHLSVLALQIARDHPSNRYVLSDLEATYQYLDLHQDEAEDFIIAYHDKPIFLNVDDPRDPLEPWTWHCADEMFFNIADGNLKPVRAFLQPFRDLLYVAGVEELVNPAVPDGGLAVTAQSKLSALYNGFNLLRIEGKLVDVVFIAEDDERFLAHRAILAPMSDYLNDLFCGDFTESRAASSDDPIEIEVEFPGKCVSIILEYLYTGVPPDLDVLELANALDALDLSQYWGLSDLNKLIQVSIIKKNFITPLSYEEILQRATNLDATMLLEACQFYERQNMDAIQRLKGNYHGPRKPRRLPKKIAPYPAYTFTSTMALDATTSPKPKRMKKLMHRLSNWARKSTG